MYDRSLICLSLFVALGLAPLCRGDEPTSRTGTAQATPTPPSTGGSGLDTATTEARPGRFRIGPLYLTPHIRIGSIGLDTNVFYTPTDRQTDVGGSIGPGLDMVIPLGKTFRLTGQGGLDYLYFVRTASQRRFTGEGGGGLEWSGARTSGNVLGRYDKTFNRLSTEVDRRIEQVQRSVHLTLRRRLAGRTSFNLSGTASRQETPAGQTFLGTDLSTTLSTDSYQGTAGLEYALTAKTGMVLEGGYERTRFPKDPQRDAERPHVALGLHCDSATLISGRLFAGYRWHRSVDRSIPAEQSFYADADVTWHLSPRTQITGSYNQDIGYSAFTPVSGAATVRQESFGGRLHKDLFKNFDISLQARRFHTRTDSPVRLVLEGGETVLVRDDVSYDYDGELGYRVLTRLWMGGTVGYGKRRSTISDLGVEGLLLGGKVVFTP